MISRVLLSHGRAALTLIEVLVVLGVIALLLGLSLAGVQKARASAARVRCAANLGQLSIAAHSYAATNGSLPAGCAYPDPRFREIDVVPVSWQTALLPYLEQTDLAQLAAEAYSLAPRGESPLHETVRTTVLPSMLCPTEVRSVGGFPDSAEWAISSYHGVSGTGLRNDDGVLEPRLAIRLTDVTDGTSGTLMVGERPAGPSGAFGSWYAGWGLGCVCQTAQILPASHDPWTTSYAADCPSSAAVFRPGQIDSFCDVNHYWSLHPGGANFAFADGSVRFLSYSTDDILPALATRAGGEVVTVPD